MAKYNIIYRKFIYEEEYNNTKKTLPPHKIIPTRFVISYWEGKPEDREKQICIELTESITAESEIIAIAVVDEWIKEGEIILILGFKLTDENDNLIYSDKDYKEENDSPN